MTQKPVAYEAYQEFADAYAEHVETKPHNAYYDRPAMLSMLPDVRGRRVLDAGCGPGVYAAELIRREAIVVACDVSERMLELAENRLQGTAELMLVDLTKPLIRFEDRSFDVVNAPLCLDYIGDWKSLFIEFCRILKPGGIFLFSCGHPSFDAEYFDTENYFSVEFVQSIWTGFGQEVLMPSYRRSIEEAINPVIEAGFMLDRVHEPQPTDEFKQADPARYENLMRRPGFLCVRARKPE